MASLFSLLFSWWFYNLTDTEFKTRRVTLIPKSYPQGGTRGRGWWKTSPPSFRLSFWYVALFRNDFAFDLLYKMRYILWLVALMEVSKLEFYKELDIK